MSAVRTLLVCAASVLLACDTPTEPASQNPVGTYELIGMQSYFLAPPGGTFVPLPFADGVADEFAVSGGELILRQDGSFVRRITYTAYGTIGERTGVWSATPDSSALNVSFQATAISPGVFYEGEFDFSALLREDRLVGTSWETHTCCWSWVWSRVP